MVVTCEDNHAIGTPRRVVVLRHGIAINRYFMLPMERYFRRRGFEVHNRTYPSTKKSIPELASEFAEEITQLDEELAAVDSPYELYFVTHSMGGLVLRYALTHFSMPKIRRAVLMVPPNRGSTTARYFRGCFLYRWIFGTHAAAELASESAEIYEACGVPEECDVGVIAGDVPWRLHPVRLDKPHDGVVSVSEAELPPYPLKVLPYGHTPILFVRYAMEEAEHFLTRGQFRPAS